jgi:hypothetical protein
MPPPAFRGVDEEDNTRALVAIGGRSKDVPIRYRDGNYQKWVTPNEGTIVWIELSFYL